MRKGGIMRISSSSDIESIVATHIALKCPHCQSTVGLLPISVPKYSLVVKHKPKDVGLSYMCPACSSTVFLRFTYRNEPHEVVISDEFRVVEFPKELYDFSKLPDSVALEFEEALDCYSNGSYNAFGVMCRRTIQAAGEELGTPGKDKVTAQVRELKERGLFDEETFKIADALVVNTHDSAHPNLPRFDAKRADMVLALMKDVLYQLFVRFAYLDEANKLRTAAIGDRAAEKKKTQ